LFYYVTHLALKLSFPERAITTLIYSP